MLVLFAASILLAVRLPPLAAALTILMIPLEQVVQGAAPALRAGAGGQLVNYLIGGTCLLSTGLAVLRTPDRASRIVTSTLVLTLALYLWATVSLIWSPGRQAGLEMVTWGTPYLGVTILLAPILIKDVEEYAAFNRWVVVIGTLIILGYLSNPVFEMKLGRLTMSLGGGMVSSALAVGELGGTVLVSAALARGGEFGLLGNMIRFSATIAAIALAIMSGSRGQFFFAILIVVLFIPAAAPILNVRRFVGTALAITFIGIAAYLAMGFILEGFAAKRFDTEQLLYGSSSASGRIRNSMLLLEAWLQDPKAPLLGLGYNAFSALPGAFGEPYSHVMMADAIFELGLVGLVLTLVGLYIPVMAGIRLFRRHVANPVHRAAIATLLAQITYQFLLTNKQGSLWGVPVIFFYLLAAARMEAIESDHEAPVDDLSANTGQSGNLADTAIG